MKNIIYLFYTTMLALLTISFTACSDDEETYDFPGDPYNRVYLMDKTSAYKIIQTPISTVSNLEFKLPVKCTRRTSGNIKATVEIDNSLVSNYNEKYKTNYQEMPAAAVVLENATMNIPAGEVVSGDTLRVTLTKDEKILSTLKSKEGYLIPLRITTTEGGDAQASTNVNAAYITVTVTEDNINHEGTENDIKGTLVADQSGWSATTTGSASSYYEPIETMFNGDANTVCSISGNGGIYVEINMGKPYTFDAIQFYYGYDYSAWGGGKGENGSLSKGMALYTSNDGTNWESAGEITGDGAKYCIFYAPVTCQYLRIATPEEGYFYITAGVFNVFAK